MKKIFLILSVATIFVACDNKNVGTDAYKGLDKQKQELAELDSITQQARKTFDDFKLALELKDGNLSNFIVKQEYIVKDGQTDRQEHVWIRDVYYDNGVLKGIVDNQPVLTKEVKLNDTIAIDENRISDWLFYKLEPNDTVAKVIGGYSIKYARNKMSDAEKAEFDKQYKAKFD